MSIIGSIIDRLCGPPQTIEGFVEFISARRENLSVIISIEEKSSCSPVIPDVATYEARMVARCGRWELRLPWIPTGGYYGQAGWAWTVAGTETEHQLRLKIGQLTSLLQEKGMSYEIIDKPVIVFGSRKYF